MINEQIMNSKVAVVRGKRTWYNGQNDRCERKGRI